MGQEKRPLSWKEPFGFSRRKDIHHSCWKKWSRWTNGLRWVYGWLCHEITQQFTGQSNVCTLGVEYCFFQPCPFGLTCFSSLRFNATTRVICLKNWARTINDEGFGSDVSPRWSTTEQDWGLTANPNFVGYHQWAPSKLIHLFILLTNAGRRINQKVVHTCRMGCGDESI